MPSKVHRRSTDVVDLSRRKSVSRSLRSPDVLDFLRSSLLPEIQTFYQGRLELYTGHYDIIAYPRGGFFSKHVDYVSYYGPGLRCWHTLVCLAAPRCEGGETLIHVGSEVYRSNFTVTPGGLLSILAGTPHEGSLVLHGKKVVLKFEFFEFSEHRVSALEPSSDLVPCVCKDGTVHAPLRLLLKQAFFQKLVSFERNSSSIKLEGFLMRDLQSLLSFMEGRCVPENSTEDLQWVFDYMCAPEQVLSESELLDLLARGFLKTSDRSSADRFASLDGLDYTFLGVVQEWSVGVEHIWDVLLEFEVDPRTAYSQIAVVVAGRPMFAVSLPGRKQLFAGCKRAILPLNEYFPAARLEIFEEDLVGEDTFACMQNLLRMQISEDSAQEESKNSAAGRTESFHSAQAPLSIRQSKRLAMLLLKKSSPEEFKKVLTSFVQKQTTAEDVYEEACNDGESFLSTTLYKTRILNFEWAVFRRDFLLQL
jgi:hypothetical protein